MRVRIRTVCNLEQTRLMGDQCVMVRRGRTLRHKWSTFNRVLQDIAAQREHRMTRSKGAVTELKLSCHFVRLSCNESGSSYDQLQVCQLINRYCKQTVWQAQPTPPPRHQQTIYTQPCMTL